MYVYQEFPKWKYHREKEALIVEDKKSEKALGKGWFNSPTLVEDGQDLPSEDSQSKAPLKGAKT